MRETELHRSKIVSNFGHAQRAVTQRETTGRSSLTDLARGFNALEQAKETDDPGEHQTQCHVPFGLS